MNYKSKLSIIIVLLPCLLITMMLPFALPGREIASAQAYNRYSMATSNKWLPLLHFIRTDCWRMF